MDGVNSDTFASGVDITVERSCADIGMWFGEDVLVLMNLTALMKS